MSTYKHLTHKIIHLIVLLALLTSCAPAATPKATPLATSAVPYNLTPKADATTLAALSAANNAFGLDLYQAIRTEPGNLFYSPYSIALALSMVYAGARGDTEQQMANALHYPVPQAQVPVAFNALNLQLTRPLPMTTVEEDQAFELNIANGLWGKKDYAFQPAYLDLIAANYGAQLQPLDVSTEATREAGRRAINDWVSQQTADRIRDLMPPGSINELTRLVLANAIYFKADWVTPFTSYAEPQAFSTLAGEQVLMPFMSLRMGFPYAATGEYQAIAIPYKGERTRMVILLPAVEQFAAFERTLTWERLETILASLRPSDVRLTLPKFRYETKLDLARTLADLGMAAPFTAGEADLSGIDGTRNLYISQVFHKAFVAVDEKGTEAAAATGITVEVTSLPTSMIVDRPFVFLIQDTETGTILFMGRFVAPEE